MKVVSTKLVSAAGVCDKRGGKLCERLDSLVRDIEMDSLFSQCSVSESEKRITNLIKTGERTNDNVHEA